MMAATPGVNAGIHSQGDYFQQSAGAQQQQPQQERPLYLCQPFVKAALVKGSFKTIVAPPKYVDVNEWVAINSK
jgi:MOB kinase activator 1